jgi:hypothetical protein
MATPTRLPVLLHSRKSAAADFVKAQMRQPRLHSSR